ncbi:MAG: nitroreductase family protein [Lachnospiraceae bacterium]
MKTHKIQINQDKCVGCASCVMDCPLHNLKVEQQKARVIRAGCLFCGHCAAVCPMGAVTITGFSIAPEAVPKESPVPAPASHLAFMKFRRSIRQFRKDPVPREALQHILEAGSLTHTAANARDVSFVVLEKNLQQAEAQAVKAARSLQKVGGLFRPDLRGLTIDSNFFFHGAPTAIVIYARDRADGDLAAENMAAQAECEGLGVLFSGLFTAAVNHVPAVGRAMDVSTKKKAVMTLVIGIPGVRYQRSVPRDPASVLYR